MSIHSRIANAALEVVASFINPAGHDNLIDFAAMVQYNASRDDWVSVGRSALGLRKSMGTRDVFNFEDISPQAHESVSIMERMEVVLQREKAENATREAKEAQARAQQLTREIARQNEEILESNFQLTLLAASVVTLTAALIWAMGKEVKSFIEVKIRRPIYDRWFFEWVPHYDFGRIVLQLKGAQPARFFDTDGRGRIILITPVMQDSVRPAPEVFRVLHVRLVNRTRNAMKPYHAEDFETWSETGVREVVDRLRYRDQERKHLFMLVGWCKNTLMMMAKTYLEDDSVRKKLDGFVGPSQEKFESIYKQLHSMERNADGSPDSNDDKEKSNTYVEMTSLASTVGLVAALVLQQNSLRQPMHDRTDLEELMVHTSCAHQLTTALCRDIAAVAGGQALGLELKSFFRTIEKASLTGYGVQQALPMFDDAKDMARGAIQFDDLSGLVVAQKTLIQKHGEGTLQILRVKDRFSSPSKGGWSDQLIYFRFTYGPARITFARCSSPCGK